jgi:dTDP-4-dehydrorhamnose reductase
MSTRPGPIRTAGIVGLHWGLVHLRGLREAGCEVVALAAANEDEAREAAEREGVPRATADVSSLNDLDLVVIATPAATHVDVINALPSPRLICEKPLVGVAGDPGALPDTEGRLLVNLAFPYLHTARAVASVVAELGPPERTELQVDVGMELTFTPEEWFLETASHPLSWLLHLFGPPTVHDRAIAEDAVAVELSAGRVPLTVQLRLDGLPGIEHRVLMEWAGRTLRVEGRYRPGEPWRYDPIQLDGQPINEGEWSATDCWMDANAACEAAIISVFRGELGWDRGLASGLFDARKALMLESVLRQEPDA